MIIISYCYWIHIQAQRILLYPGNMVWDIRLRLCSGSAAACYLCASATPSPTAVHNGELAASPPAGSTPQQPRKEISTP